VPKTNIIESLAGKILEICQASVKTRGRKVVTASLVAAALYGFKLVNEGYFASREEKERLARETTKKKGGKGNVDSVFFKRILHLLKTVLPDAKCREAQYIYLLGILLVVRTILSIWLADV